MKNNHSLSILIILASIIITTHSASSQEQSTLEKIRQQQALQGGIFAGKVTDAQTGDDLIGANVFMVGTKLGASTDIDGKFQIKRVPEGSYEVLITFLGYEAKRISGVEIKTGETMVLNISLSEDQGIQQQEVVISAEVIRSGEGGMLAERRTQAGIGDGISSEQIRRAPDATSGDALRRVTGVTLVDNKYIFIRGVTDRYNQTTLNGASVTSTNADKKSFSFDMLPSNLLDHMNVAKTASPDLPGDFTGGLVQIKTLDVPERLSLKLTTAGMFNSITTFRDFRRSSGGVSDWTGSDDGTRGFPSGSGSSSSLGSLLPNTWASSPAGGPIAQSFSVSVGDRFTVGEDQLGVIAAGSYRNNYQHTGIAIKEFGGGQLRRMVSGFSDKMSVLWGGLFDLSYKTGGTHTLSLKNNYNRAAEDKVYHLSGYKADDDENVRSYQSEWEQRGMYAGQFAGEHHFPEYFGTAVDWMINFSQARTEQPDRKELVYSASPYSDQPMSAKPGERSWGTIYEKTSGQRFNAAVTADPVKFRFGVFNEHRVKNFSMNFYQVSNNGLSQENYALATYGIDSIYRPENFGTGKFSLISFDNSSGAYHADQDLFAYYGMADIPFEVSGQRFRLSGGLRIERSRQSVSTAQGRLGADPVGSTLFTTDLLPSATITFVIDERQNFRAAYSHTVNRPEFRERSAFYYYDFDRSEYVRGNAQLTRALIRNYDLRYEFFPSFGDVMAASYFYKSLTDPIEETRTYTSFTERTWINAPSGKNYGWEFEIRKNLSFISDYLALSSVSANYTRIISSVPFRENKGNSTALQFIEGERQMQGQSPYLWNVSVSFTEPTFGTAVNVLYNEYGSRIDAVGDIKAGDGDVYEQKRGTLDLSLTQPLGMMMKGLEWRFSAKNLNNQPIVFTQGRDVHRMNTVGINYTMQLSYSL